MSKTTAEGEWTRRQFFAGLTVASVSGGLILSGEPAQAQETADGRPVSGFLGDYSKLLPAPGNGDLLLYLRDANALKNYHKFIFDPVNIYLLPESPAHAAPSVPADRFRPRRSEPAPSPKWESALRRSAGAESVLLSNAAYESDHRRRVLRSVPLWPPCF